MIITAFVAIVATNVYFAKPEFARRYHIGFLALMFLGASLMWCVDGCPASSEDGPFVELSDPKSYGR